MIEENRTSPDDLEAGNSHRDLPEEGDELSGPFDIVRTKSAPVDRLRRWRQAALVLNASRRFRYTLDLKKEEEREKLLGKIRTHAQVIRAAVLFQVAGQELNDGQLSFCELQLLSTFITWSLVEILHLGQGISELPSSPIQNGEFGVSADELVSVSREHDLPRLQQFGGASSSLFCSSAYLSLLSLLTTGVAEKLKSSLDKGVPGNETDLMKRKKAFGSNTYPRKKGRSFWRFVLDACRDTTLIILMVAAAASLALGIKTEGIKEGWYDGGSIAIAVLIVIVFTAVSDYKQSLQFQNLNEEKQNIQMEVIRSGRRIKISIFDIVVGDVVPLKIGDQVPADGLVVSCHSLSIDESSMTGESKIVHKDPTRTPFLMSGCKVADGYGTMLVTCVGINTEWGLLMASISEDNGEETPLQVRLNGVATFIGIAGLAVAVIVLIVLVARYFTGHTRDPYGRVQFTAGKTKVGDAIDGFIKIFTVAGCQLIWVNPQVTIVVVAVPEGLPLAVTLTLAYSMRKMMADKALVRRLSACETMGSATTICSDKTGTLTLNQMTVVEVYACDKKIDPPDNKSLLPPTAVSLLFEGIAQNTTGSVYVAENGGAPEVSGSPTEKAILQWGVKLGMDFGAVQSDSVIIHALPFNSEKKRGGVALKLSDSKVHVHWKGAAEIVLASCTSHIDANDCVVPMDEDKLSFYKKAIEDMAAGSLRCVAIACRLCEMEKVPTTDEELENWQFPEGDLILLAIVGIKDPCRPGVKDAVQLCINAGIKVRMVTGDNLQTARAIALECGVLGSNADATEPDLIEGRTFRSLTETQRLEVVDKISVMGRSSPNDKLLLVQALRKKGHVVAVTGDGTNDAPALHEADIGLAMGIQGTEVAKESSDIIILDDNFASVVKVVRWGRSVYANIQKFIQFQLTVNVAALIINVVAAVSAGNVPLNAVQLLWVNLIMDTLGALALATEPPTDHLMRRRPVGRREPLITNIMWRNLLIQAAYQVTVLLVLNFRGRSILNLEHDSSDHAFKVKNTLIFNAFVLYVYSVCKLFDSNIDLFWHIFNEFNARKPDGINVWKGVTKNHLFMGIVGLELVLQVIIIFFLGKFTSTVRLSWKLWLVSFAIGLVSWPLAIVGKLIPVPEKNFSEFLIKKTRQPRNSNG
ncbi:calcium-transporting ATPase 8 family protein [Striga asiatica]|uniref:Calcium-transporting ATPase n=1 Tax=Striga asiatica TaxID=4170 RepID=A0A5A7QHH5_STRAF|nr:calcium-transporting ATPase 8 family protein [Striga asiatica]